MKKYLIVGLGNTDYEYLFTRHNIGFLVVDALAKAQEVRFEKYRFGDLAVVKIKGCQAYLLKPDTYVNFSGRAVNHWVKRLKINLENILVITDDIHLPFGTFRLRNKGSDGGHNGLKSIQEELQSKEYPRFRFGVGGDFQKGKQIDYVLGNWKTTEVRHLEYLLEDASELVTSFVLSGLPATVNAYNGIRLKKS